MVITLVAIGAFVLLRAVTRSDLEVEPEAVDYRAAAAAVYDDGGRVVYPVRLPRGWIATSIDYVPGERPAWGVGMLTDAGDFVGVRQEDAPLDDLLTTYVDEQTVKGSPITVTGSVARRWQAYADEGGDHAYAAELGNDEVLVYGSAPTADLRRVLGLLTDRKPGAGLLLLGGGRDRVEALPSAVAPALAGGGEQLPALPEGQRLLEGRATGLEPAHDVDQLFARGLVGQLLLARGGRFRGGHSCSSRRGSRGVGAASCSTPVVSAIGHEPDGPLLDLVADVRASTPTDAAKLVVPDVAEESARVGHLRDRARHVMGAWLAREQHALDTLRGRPVLADPGSRLEDRRREVDALRDRARRSVHHQLDRAGNDLDHQLARVRGLSPLATLRRGYAVVQDADGHVVTAPGQVRIGQPLQIRVSDGRIAAQVTSSDETSETHE